MRKKDFYFQTLQSTISLYFKLPLKMFYNHSLEEIYKICKEENFLQLDYSSPKSFKDDVQNLMKKIHQISNKKELEIFLKRFKDIKLKPTEKMIKKISITYTTNKPFFEKALFENKSYKIMKIIFYLYMLLNSPQKNKYKLMGFIYKSMHIGDKILLIGPNLDENMISDENKLEYIKKIKTLFDLDMHSIELLNLLNQIDIGSQEEITMIQNHLEKIFLYVNSYYDKNKTYKKPFLRELAAYFIYLSLNHKDMIIDIKSIEPIKNTLTQRLLKTIQSNQSIRTLESLEWFNELTFKNMSFDTSFKEYSYTPLLFLKEQIEADGYIFCRYYQYSNQFELSEYSDISDKLKKELTEFIEQINQNPKLLNESLSYEIIQEYEKYKKPIKLIQNTKDYKSRLCDKNSNIKSILSIPLIFDKRVFAVLHFISYEEYRFDEMDRRFLLKLSSSLSRKYMDNIFDASIENMILLLEELHTKKGQEYLTKKTDKVCEDIAKTFSSDGVILWFNKREIFHHTQKEFDEIHIESQVNFLDEEEIKNNEKYPINRDLDDNLIKLNIHKEVLVVDDIEKKCQDIINSNCFMKYKNKFLQKGIKSFMLAIIKNYEGKLSGALMIFNKDKRVYNELSQRMLIRIAFHIGTILNTLAYTQYKNQKIDERVLHESGQYLNIIDSRAKELEKRLKDIYIPPINNRHKIFLNIQDIKDYISYTKSFLYKLFKDGKVVKKYDDLLFKDIKNIKENTSYTYIKKSINQVLAVNKQKMINEKNIRYQNRLEYKIKVKIPNKQLHDIFNNLINNAIKYGKIGSYIKLTDELTEYYYNIFIENIGYKIEEEESRDIFRKGVRGRVIKELSKEKKEFQESMSENKGIGLFYVKEILRSIKGNVRLIQTQPIDSRFSKNIFELKIPIKYVRNEYDKNLMA